LIPPISDFSVAAQQAAVQGKPWPPPEKQQFAGVQLGSQAGIPGPHPQAPPSREEQQKELAAMLQTSERQGAEMRRTAALDTWARQYQEWQQKYGAQAKAYAAYAHSMGQKRQTLIQQYNAPEMAQARAQPMRGQMALVQRGISTQTAQGSVTTQQIQQEQRRLFEESKKLRRKEAQLQAEERAEAQEKQQLDARSAALSQKEQRVTKMQQDLLSEQRKIWRVLNTRKGQPQAGARAAPLRPAPQAVAHSEQAAAEANVEKTLAPPVAPMLPARPEAQEPPAQHSLTVEAKAHLVDDPGAQPRVVSLRSFGPDMVVTSGGHPRAKSARGFSLAQSGSTTRTQRARQEPEDADATWREAQPDGEAAEASEEPQDSEDTSPALPARNHQQVAALQTSSQAKSGASSQASAGTGAEASSKVDPPGSDLHVVLAANLPPEKEDDEDSAGVETAADDEESAKAGSAGGSEDSAATAAEDAKGENSDNDDLEQILLQQGARHRRVIDKNASR